MRSKASAHWKSYRVLKKTRHKTSNSFFGLSGNTERWQTVFQHGSEITRESLDEIRKRIENNL